MDKDQPSQQSDIDKDQPGLQSNTDRDQPSPQSNSNTDSDQPSPQSNTDRDQPSPQSNTDRDQPSPQSSTGRDQPFPQYNTDRDQPSPQSNTDSDQPSPQSNNGMDQPSPQSDTDSDQPPSQSNTDGDQPSPQSNTDRDKPSPQSNTDRGQPSPQSNTDRDQPSPQSSTGRDQPSSQFSSDRIQPSLQSDVDDLISQFVEAVILYNCVGREGRLARCKLLQFLPDRPDGVEGDFITVDVGSVWEGTPMQVVADINQMFYDSSWPHVVCDPLKCQISPGQHCLVPSPNRNNPGYLRLRIRDSVDSPFVNIAAEGYIQSDQFAAQFNMSNASGFLTQSHNANFLLSSQAPRDCVPCLVSPHWPPCTDEFFSRPRPRGWPSKKLLANIQKGGCHVVAKTSPNSVRPDLEFRWSFSVAEKNLFHDMDDKMDACLYLLKSIKTKHWGKESNPAIFYSYFLKMACLWTSELNAPSSSVITLTIEALDWLIMCYNVHNLPHYFIANQNLIGHLSAEACKATSSKLLQIKQDLRSQPFSYMELDQPVKEMVDSIHTMIKCQVQDLVGGKYKECFRFLSDIAGLVLFIQGQTKSILPDGDLYLKKQKQCPSSELHLVRSEVYRRIQKVVLECKLTASDLPTGVVDPILQKLKSIATGSLVTYIEHSIQMAIEAISLELNNPSPEPITGTGPTSPVSKPSRNKPSPKHISDKDQPSQKYITKDQPSPTPNPDGVVRQFVEDVILYNCAGREARVTKCQLLQFVPERLDEVAGNPIAIETGSKWEGMPQAICSDEDKMFYQPSWPVVLCDRPSSEMAFSGEWLLADVIKDQPAFLHLAIAGKSDSKFRDYERNGYLRSDLFVQQFQQDKSEVHGPALTSSAFNFMPYVSLKDHVPCLISPNWPPCADEFFLRHRPHGWPSKKLLADIKKAGCHVVAKASPNSGRPDHGTDMDQTSIKNLEFRWSFSVAEKNLFHNMDVKMDACLYLLKSIKKQHWDEDSNPGICSYFQKMACLWTSEQNEPRSSVFQLTTTALEWLIMCYNVHNLPHYFITNQNLIGHLSADTCKAIAAELIQIKLNLTVESLSCVQMDKPVLDIVQKLAFGSQCQAQQGGDSTQALDMLYDCALVVGEDASKNILASFYDGQQVGCMINELREMKYELFKRFQKLVRHGLSLSELSEKVIKPFLQNIKSSASEPLAKNIKTCTYSALGDVCLQLLLGVRVGAIPMSADNSTHPDYNTSPIPAMVNQQVDLTNSQKQPLSEENSESKSKKHSSCTVQELRSLAQHYYILACVPLESPDGSTDGGFVGKVNLAMLYSETEQWDKLGRMVGELEASLIKNSMQQWNAMSVSYFSGPSKLFSPAFLTYDGRPFLSDMDGKIELRFDSTEVADILLCVWAEKQGDTELLERVSSSRDGFCQFKNELIETYPNVQEIIEGFIGQCLTEIKEEDCDSFFDELCVNIQSFFSDTLDAKLPPINQRLLGKALERLFGAVREGILELLHLTLGDREGLCVPSGAVPPYMSLISEAMIADLMTLNTDTLREKKFNLANCMHFLRSVCRVSVRGKGGLSESETEYNAKAQDLLTDTVVKVVWAFMCTITDSLRCCGFPINDSALDQIPEPLEMAFKDLMAKLLNIHPYLRQAQTVPADELFASLRRAITATVKYFFFPILESVLLYIVNTNMILTIMETPFAEAFKLF